jgi:outer membrane protein OmpA-like peptidoglycan-associated protein/ABC-type nitrate/sulfonate/bicarbonate transport system substrate-binding protein
MEKLTPLGWSLIGVIVLGSAVAAMQTYGGLGADAASPAQAAPASQPSPEAPLAVRTEALAAAAATASPSPASLSLAKIDSRPVRVALSQWPGHLALVVGAGGLTTQPGSPAAAENLNLEIVFIEDAPSKNKALETGEVDFVWQTVDELPISLGGYAASKTDVRAFLQIDWSRGGDACVASKEIQTVEDILGHRSAMLMFSPDHTVFEFMISNSRLNESQVAAVRAATQFSMDDFAFGRVLFTENKVDVACLWEPDVTLALAGRPGAHRLFSTADATELVADVLLTRKELLDTRPDVAKKLAKTWFRAVEKAEKDRTAAANLIAKSCSRFRDELGPEKTLAALGWAKWTNLADNVRLFGLDGNVPGFDRVYNQADSIWINYPQAEIKDRFAPAVLRDDRIVRGLWEEAGKPAVTPSENYDPSVAFRGAALFTKPVSIGFEPSSAALSPTALASINKDILPQLEIARGMSIRVEGNTDNIGSDAENLVLSQQRARAIVEYLVMRGVPRNRLLARGNGASKPIATNKTREGRALNRRTDILFIRSDA